jgi:hypothetical protein
MGRDGGIEVGLADVGDRPAEDFSETLSSRQQENLYIHYLAK